MSEQISQPLVDVKNVTGGYDDITVVRDVSFSVYPGKIAAVLGRNGAGKTTTLRLVSGLNPLRKGTVTLDGVELGGLPAYKRTSLGIAYVQEGKRIFRQRTVRENIMLGAYPLRLGRKELAGAVEEAYSRFPALALKKDVEAGLLSGGQQQMLAIAQALAARPRVLMLDEPTTGLAPAIVGELFDLLVRLRDEGLAVLLVEQAVEFCLELADDAIVLNLGSVAYSGPADSPKTRAAVETAYMGAELA
ncbi:ABC transporter ATP-binding protein [Glaciibacter sp. 2TAF33]|uniref:ABC transporter ATP-binding protein n=1 Tax=Glaciibacter sp. 2TAF33 TaxID=3233015 RepID=UPI003F93F192